MRFCLGMKMLSFLGGQRVDGLSRNGWCPRAPVENGTWSYVRKVPAEIKKEERTSTEIVISHHHAGIISSSLAPKPCCNCHTDNIALFLINCAQIGASIVYRVLSTLLFC